MLKRLICILSLAALTSLTAAAQPPSVTISWNANVTAGTITSFTVLRSTTSTGTYASVGSVPFVTGTTAYSYTDTTVVQGGSYYYEIESVGPGGTSAPTAPSPVAVVPFQAPATPSTPTVVVNP
jgi:fibronectin type 3 domain-containing protein